MGQLDKTPKIFVGVPGVRPRFELWIATRGGEQVCVRCWQENILENGHDAEEFERGSVPGDFYNHQDLSSHDWVLVQGMGHSHITGQESAKKFADRALELIDEGNKVLVNYDSMGIGGGEGFVSLYIKPAVMARKEVVK